jgi:hypothetical protein
MLDVLERLGPRQKTMLLQGMNTGFTERIITADNRQQIVQRDLLEVAPRFHRKRFCYISLAKDLFPAKYFCKQND